MKISRIVSLVLFAACAFAVSATHATLDLIAGTALALKNIVLDGFELAAGEIAHPQRPFIARVKAKAFLQRLAQRTRPEITGSWRMCSST